MSEMNLQRGLQAYYTFDGADTDSQRNQIRDRSGYGHHGDLNGGVTTGVTSALGEGLSFDGTDDWVDTGMNDSVAFDVQDSFTLFAAAKPSFTGENSTGNIFGKGIHSGSYGISAYNSGRIWAGVRDTDDNKAIISAGHPDGQLGIFVLEYSADKMEVRLWVDGELNGTDTASFTGSFTDPRNLTLGDTSVVQGTQVYYTGEIHAAGIWNRLLSPSEIQSLSRTTARRVAHL